jgi:hypothetical protein
MKRLAIIPLLTLLSCGAARDPVRIARPLNEAARSIQVVQGAVITSHDLGLVDKETADAVVTITVRVARAIGEANRLTRNLSKIPEANRDSVLAIIGPVMQSLQAALLNPKLSGIADEQLRTRIMIGLQAGLTGLEAARSILEVQSAE